MKDMKFILRLVLTLFLISALVAGALAAVNSITEERIAKAKEEKLRAAVSRVLGGAESFEALEGFADDTGLVSKVYTAEGNYAVEVNPAGFGGKLTMMVGVSADGKVLGIQVVSHTETAGLGAVAAADTTAGNAFRDSFLGLDGTVAVSKDGGQADTITGATITSRAVAQGVNAALRCVEALGKGE